MVYHMQINAIHQINRTNDKNHMIISKAAEKYLQHLIPFHDKNSQQIRKKKFTSTYKYHTANLMKVFPLWCTTRQGCLLL